jgi:hypothetical protein
MCDEKMLVDGVRIWGWLEAEVEVCEVGSGGLVGVGRQVFSCGFQDGDDCWPIWIRHDGFVQVVATGNDVEVFDGDLDWIIQ